MKRTEGALAPVPPAAGPPEKKRIKLVIPFKGGLPASKEDDRVMEAICCTDDLALAFLTVKNAAPGNVFGNNQDISSSAALSQIAALAPETPLEAILISQMVAINATAGNLMERAMTEGQPLEYCERNLNLATKLQRTFVAQVEALQKLRGKGGQQVRVEHVHVHEGGQAIVGNVNHKAKGGEGGAKGG
jgi:hypothetical protein